MDEWGGDVKREGRCVKEVIKSGEVGFSVFKSLAEKRREAVTATATVVSGESMCARVRRGKRIRGVFLAVDGQLNAWLVKTAVQNVPHARRQRRSHTHTQIHA